MAKKEVEEGYFTFKEFRIKQTQTTLKVCTESCLFGAVIALEHRELQVLDIGTGTGLLPIMLAQRYPLASFSGIEIDKLATEEAVFNAQQSPWSSRLNFQEADLLAYTSALPFDVIICNPPFFKDNLLGTNEQKNKAIHASPDFSFSVLAEKVNELLVEEGHFWCLLPPYEMEVLNSELVKLGIVYFTKIEIKHNPIKSTFREIRQFLKTEKEVAHQNKLLIIKDLAGNYSSEFVELLKPYYLHL